ncbi:hypothetical protein [Streptomyces cadmiisoli]|uniref:hypothetical protein n=1 Tax=Streptomyces cadmiisoli TaxID=2184053 RepID=UPI003D76322A
MAVDLLSPVGRGAMTWPLRLRQAARRSVPEALVTLSWTWQRIGKGDMCHTLAFVTSDRAVAVN